MFDFFVLQTLWIYEIFENYDWIFKFFYFISSFTAFMIFKYHELNYADLNFFLKNADTLYDFSKTRYNFHKAVFTTILPFAMYLIITSLIQRFDSRKFLTRYG